MRGGGAKLCLAGYVEVVSGGREGISDKILVR